MRGRSIATLVAVLCAGVLGAACSSGGADGAPGVSPGATSTADATVEDTTVADPSPPVTVAPSTGATSGAAATDGDPGASPAVTAAVPPASDHVASAEQRPWSAGVRELVGRLASDELNGRNNQTPESLVAQELLIAELSEFAEPLGDDYRQPFHLGTNIVGIVPGDELADEYVLIGAHYDHLEPIQCQSFGDPADTVCNGATDNATGVAEVLAIAAQVAASGPPRRSLVVALWDAEEDGLWGSKHYVQEPLVPLEDTVAYLNFDIQGANLTPSLANWTTIIGAESGGPDMVAAVEGATERSPLDHLVVGLAFSQGRSDHKILYAAGVPVAFFADGTNGCYHTVRDDLGAVNFDKLDEQVAVALDVTMRLLETDDPPVYDPSPPAVEFDDVVSFLALMHDLQADLPDLRPAEASEVEAFTGALEAIVAAGPEQFDPGTVGATFGAGARFVELLEGIDCELGRP